MTYEMSGFYNPLKLIAEIQKRPGLFDLEHPADRTEKLELWKEVGKAMCSDWAECNKATAYDRVLQLQKKWRSLREAYNRELRARKSGVRPHKRVYIYFKPMSFLGGFDGKVEDEDEIYYNVESIQSDPPTDDDPLIATVSTKQSKKRRAKRPPSYHEPSEETEMSLTSFDCPSAKSEEKMDSDKLFMMSFLPEMRQLPSHIKMWARAQIAGVMQEAVGCHYNDTMPETKLRNMEIKRQRDSSD